MPKEEEILDKIKKNSELEKQFLRDMILRGNSNKTAEELEQKEKRIREKYSREGPYLTM